MHTSAAFMLDNAQNTLIAGGSFKITNINAGPKVPSPVPSLDVLHRRVATNAILNAGGRADEVRCHPGTREEVINRIESWIDRQGGVTPPILWLSGPAGAGKSAIMQTIAERCKQRKALQANFFFFRVDTSRSNASPLLATLLHQIILHHPSLRCSVAALLDANPLIFDSTLEDQLVQLIITPLRSIQRTSPSYRQLLLLIDGLDECDAETKRSQQQIIDAFDKVLIETPCPFCLLIASRDEFQIRKAFNSISSPCLYLYLDGQYSPERDIRVFVDAQFEQVRKTHPLAHTLEESWPSIEDVIKIVEKSSGQFIYAATVMRFITDSSESPVLSLERVQGAAKLAATTKSPFAYLDAIFTYILSRANDQEALKDILHSQIVLNIVEDPFPPYSRLKPLTGLLGRFNPRYTETTVLSWLADLTPLVDYEANSSKLHFHHASFPDYLLDQSRSRVYFVDISAFIYRILPVFWESFTKHDLNDRRWLGFGLSAIRHLQKLPSGFTNTLASQNMGWPHFDLKDSPTSSLTIFKTIYHLSISDDDIDCYRRIVRNWIAQLPLKDDTLKFIKHVPYSTRYLEMARVDRYWNLDPDKADALRPETDFDRHESALWLSNLLRSIHRDSYGHDTRYYRQLLKAWISWAIENGISCDGLRDLPDAQRYIQERTTKKWVVNTLAAVFISKTRPSPTR